MPEAAPAQAHIQLRVVGSSGHPVAGADVQILSGGVSRSIGLTSSSGQVELGTVAAGDTVIASGSGYCASGVVVPDPAVPLLTIELRACRRVEGRVTADCPDVQMSSLTVVAVPRILSHEDRIGLLLADPRVGLAVPQADGSFQFDCLPTDQPVRITVGGPGWIDAEGPTQVRIGDPDVRLRIVPAYAVVVSLVDASGAPAAIPRVGGEATGLAANSTSADTRFSMANPWSRTLAGVPDVPDDSGSPQQAFVLAGPCSAEAVNLDIRASYPGFEPVRLEALARRTDEGAGHCVVRLDPIAGAKGTVVLKTSSEPTTLDWHGEAGTLVLRDGHGELHLFIVDRFQDGVFRLTNLPSGSYEALFEWSPVPASREAPNMRWTPLVIAPGGVVELHVDPPAWGSLAVEVQDALGQPYFGALQVLIGTVSEGHHVAGGFSIEGATVGFRQGPYVIPVVPNGRYTVQVLAVGPWIADRQDISITSNSRSKCHVRLEAPTASLDQSLRSTLLGTGTPPK